MNRRGTPDSEAVASSEDERPWPSTTTFGVLPRRESGVPGIGGGIWASQHRGSFKLSDQARRTAARETHLGAPGHAAARSAATPSPAASERANTLPFSIPLQPTPKVGRSLSHSQGQREMTFSTQEVQTPQSGMVPLGLLNEAEEGDIDTEDGYEPDGGYSRASHPPFAQLQRTVTMPSQFESFAYASGGDRRADTMDEAVFQQRLERRFDSAFGGFPADHATRRPQWQTHLGWEELPNVNESRRHSLADIPTRRGSLVGIDHDTRADLRDNNLHQPTNNGTSINTDHHTYEQDPYIIPEGYRVPQVHLEPYERAALSPTMLRPINSHNNRFQQKELYVVSFKCSRVGVFYLLSNTGLTVNEGDMVIVEADRGQDLGTVQHCRVSAEEVKILLTKYGEEQYKWLMMFSRNNQAGAVNPNANISGDSGVNLSTRPPRDQFANLKPKAIKRMAAPHEIRMLREKEGNEAKAKRACQQKVYQHGLDMEILEAEFQWDWQKLIFHYYANDYVDFKALIGDLFKLYKVRIWFSAVNPASFSEGAVGRPPSGIGPGAVLSPTSPFDQSYVMQYGADPDPYGAMMPYQLDQNAMPATNPVSAAATFAAQLAPAAIHPYAANLFQNPAMNAFGGAGPYANSFNAMAARGLDFGNNGANATSSGRSNTFMHAAPPPPPANGHDFYSHRFNAAAPNGNMPWRQNAPTRNTNGPQQRQNDITVGAVSPYARTPQEMEPFATMNHMMANMTFNNAVNNNPVEHTEDSGGVSLTGLNMNPPFGQARQNGGGRIGNPGVIGGGVQRANGGLGRGFGRGNGFTS